MGTEPTSPVFVIPDIAEGCFSVVLSVTHLSFRTPIRNPLMPISIKSLNILLTVTMK